MAKIAPPKTLPRKFASLGVINSDILTRVDATVFVCILCDSDNLCELIGIKARAADQSAVNRRLAEQLGGIVSIYAATVKHFQRVVSYNIMYVTAKFVRFGCIANFSRSYSPN